MAPDRTDCYDLIVAEWKARRHKHPDWTDPDTCLSNRPNNCGQRCLAMAAAQGSPEMFAHLVQSVREVAYKHGKVEFGLYPVDGLDDGPDSALAYVMAHGRPELLELPTVRRLLQSKWDAYGKYLLFRRMLEHLVLLCIFQVARACLKV